MSTDNETPPIVRRVNTAVFNAKCLELMDEVAQSGEEIIITKGGKPIAKLMPCRDAPESDLVAPESDQAAPEPDQDTYKGGFGRYAGMFQIYGDIVAPMPAEWFAIPDDSEEEELY